MKIEELEQIREQLRASYGAKGLLEIVEAEIRRRRNAGRKSTSKVSRREQNRVNQANFRKRQKEKTGSIE